MAEMIDRIDRVSMEDLGRVARKVFVEGAGQAKELTVVARGPRGVNECREMIRKAWKSKGLLVGSL